MPVIKPPVFSSVLIRYFCLINLVFGWSALWAQKNDTIYLLNGDRITGEVKSFDKGLLILSTDAMKKVNIEYEDIGTMFSTKNFEFRTNSGYRYYGSMLKSSTPGSVEVVTHEDTIPKPLWDLVQISRIKQRFFQRIDGSIDVGMNYTKSIDVFQYSINGYATYRSNNYSTRFEVTSILSDYGDELAENHDIGINLTRYFEHKWFGRIQLDGQKNTELNLDLRLQAGPAVGYDLVRTSPMRLYALAGILANREVKIEPADELVNLEALVSMYFYWYRYRSPKVDISTGLDVYPSLSDPGRVRAAYNISGKYEILTDLFISLTYYNNYDNRSGDSSQPQSDYNFITSLGYTF
mgnify:CR=1 FL=1